MKKILSILTVLCICGISAFAQNTAPKENIMKDKKVLVAFFSRTGENYNVGNISKSNTHIIAEMIAGETNGKLFQIEPVKPYPDEYRACVDIAKTEKENKARPAVKEDIAAGGLRCHLPGLSQLVGRYADGGLYLHRKARLEWEDRHPVLHARGQRIVRHGASFGTSLQGRDHCQRSRSSRNYRPGTRRPRQKDRAVLAE